MTEIIDFIASQIPEMEVIFKQVQGKDVPAWQLTLKHFLLCDKDYSEELKEILGKDAYREVSKVITEVVRTYVANGEMSGPNNFKIMKVERDLVKNRVCAKVYQACKDGEDVTTGLKTKLQKYSSPYCMLLKPKEERAICAVYRACQMGKENLQFNEVKEDVYSIAYTFFCLGIRKAYSVYEQALKSAGYIEDGLIAAMAGFAKTLDEYNFNTPIETGMGPGRLNIPIYNEINGVLRDCTPFYMSEATSKKIYAYDPEKHGHLTRKELMSEFHASAATVDLMLAYDNSKDMSGIAPIELEECNALPYAEEDDGFFEIELRSVLDKVLDDDERIVFDCVVNEGMKYKEIANRMGLTERKVKYLFDLCRKKLRPIYSEKYKDYEKDKKNKGST
jgi:RNA polymerase sigma factor (sigma-70 family)